MCLMLKIMNLSLELSGDNEGRYLSEWVIMITQCPTMVTSVGTLLLTD